MPAYEHHVFTCTNARDESDARGCCAQRNGVQIARWFKAESKERGWKGRIRTSKSSCFDFCEFGPVVVVYPEGVWYSPQSRDDVVAICDRHLEGGEVVEELLVPGLN